MVPFSLILSTFINTLFSSTKQSYFGTGSSTAVALHKKQNVSKEIFNTIQMSKIWTSYSCYRLQKYRFKYVIYKNQLLLQFKEQKASEWTKLMITCRNISYKNVKAKCRVKFQSTQVWKISQIFWNLSVRLLSHRFDNREMIRQ